ncbi:MAG TPA: twin-arginine translocase subunit TatC [Candidatus Methanoperedenaceae archaeon]|nr:twin-arginine translocase subunit TatC [Candidatus Methanoperedenaceae archaeon]
MNGVAGDTELPLREHLAELRNRLLVIIVVVLVVFALIFPFSGDILRMIWDDLLPGMQMIVYSPLEFLITRLTISFTGALALGVPLVVYEAFAFAGRGLYPNEKTFFFKLVPLSFLLFLLGAALAYSIAAPSIFRYTVTYAGGIAEPGISLRETFSILTTLVLGFALIFQFPLLVMASIKLGLIKREQVKGKRAVVYGLLLALAFLLPSDMTGVSQLLVAGMLAVLFELGLFASKFL